MRLTSPLFKFNVHRMFKDHWKVQGNRKILEHPIPKQLIENNVKIWDAMEVAQPKPELPKMEIPEPYKPLPPLDKSHPLWKKRVCHICNTSTQILEGLPQAQILTKTLVYDGLPQRIQKLLGVAEQPDQDELVKRCILLSQILDGCQDPLPIKKSPEVPHKDLVREYGILVKRRLELLLCNLVRLMESQTGLYRGAIQRIVSTDSVAIATTEKDNDLLQFHMNANVMISSENPLTPFSGKEKIAEEKSTPLPDIFPIKCTIDLEQTNLYEILDFYPFRKTSDYRHAHTLYLCEVQEETKWSKSQTKARALFTCYTFAVAQARSLYGAVEELPEPIAVQCVISNGAEFELLAYQLNTLNLDTSDAQRNFAWLDSDLKLYEQCFEENGKICFEGYNPDVYRRLLALHVNGLDLTSKISVNELLPTKVHDAIDAFPATAVETLKN